MLHNYEEGDLNALVHQCGPSSSWQPLIINWQPVMLCPVEPLAKYLTASATSVD